MASDKKIDKITNINKFYELQKKREDRIKDPNKKSSLDFNLTFTNKEILKIQSKGRLLRVKYGITRADVLRKVLLNLDDEELICFLGLYDIDKAKKE